MTFDPDRRDPMHDPIRQRMADGDGPGWFTGVLAAGFLLGFAYLIFAGSGAPTDTPTRESNSRIEQPAPTPPKAPN